MKLLAHCPHCNETFQSRLIGDISPSTTVAECQESCPSCGKMAQTSNYISNTMYIAGQAFHTTSDADTLKNLLQILQNGQKQNQDANQLADEIQALNHKFDDLAECIRQGKKENRVEMVWASVKYIIQFLLSMIDN
jgi:hypothetical protein